MTFCVVRVISSWHFVSYVSYPHDISCRTCQILMIFRVVRVFLTVHGGNWLAGTSFQSRYWILSFEIETRPVDACVYVLYLSFWTSNGATRCHPGSLCAPAFECLSIQREQSSSKWQKNMNKLTEHTVIIRSVAHIGILKSYRSSTRPYWLTWTGATGNRNLISMGFDLSI